MPARSTSRRAGRGASRRNDFGAVASRARCVLISSTLLERDPHTYLDSLREGKYHFSQC